VSGGIDPRAASSTSAAPAAYAEELQQCTGPTLSRGRRRAMHAVAAGRAAVLPNSCPLSPTPTAWE